jgi:hypothetical protein
VSVREVVFDLIEMDVTGSVTPYRIAGMLILRTHAQKKKDDLGANQKRITN